MKLNVLFEDSEIIIVEKPIGIDSQSAHSFEPDMVSEIKSHINNLYTNRKEPYLGVVHRLDKPVGGVMVYAKTARTADFLSKQVQSGEMKKHYLAVLCGKPVDIVGNYVDYVLKEGKCNGSRIVDKGITGAKLAELNYRILDSIVEDGRILSLCEIELLTGRHHQIRVQFAGHGFPLWGDNRYNPEFSADSSRRRVHVALNAYRLSLFHPVTKERMTFSVQPTGDIFYNFKKIPKV